METKKIKCVVTERETVDGRRFNTYKTFSKNGRATELKFRKEVTNLPKKSCYIVVNVDDINIVTSGEYPVCWVKAIQSIEDLGTFDAKRNADQVNEYFG